MKENDKDNENGNCQEGALPSRAYCDYYRKFVMPISAGSSRRGFTRRSRNKTRATVAEGVDRIAKDANEKEKEKEVDCT